MIAKSGILKEHMKKISFDETTTQVKNPETVVDDALLLDHNQNSSNTNEVETTTTQNQGRDLFMKSPKLMIILTVIAVLAGVGTGFGTFRITHKNAGEQLAAVPTEEKGVQVGDEFGSKDDAFDSHAIGYVAEGGLDGEGSHKLLRPGGDSQTVYLTSSVTDLDLFVGMEVELWGETFKGQKAGWFMDVGRVKVVNTDAEEPTEE